MGLSRVECRSAGYGFFKVVGYVNLKLVYSGDVRSDWTGFWFVFLSIINRLNSKSI